MALRAHCPLSPRLGQPADAVGGSPLGGVAITHWGEIAGLLASCVQICCSRTGDVASMGAPAGGRIRLKGVVMSESKVDASPVSIDLRHLPPVFMPEAIVLRIEEALALLALEPSDSAPSTTPSR